MSGVGGEWSKIMQDKIISNEYFQVKNYIYVNL